MRLTFSLFHLLTFSKLFPYFPCYFLKLFGRELKFGVGEVHVALGLHWHEVDMRVGYLQPEHCHAHLAARESRLDGLCHLLGEDRHFGYLAVFKVEIVVNLPSGDYQCVALGQRVNVEKSVELVALGAFVARYLAGCNLRKYVHVFGVIRFYGFEVIGFYGYGVLGDKVIQLYGRLMFCFRSRLSTLITVKLYDRITV